MDKQERARLREEASDDTDEWHKDVRALLDALEAAEAERDQARRAIERFGNNPEPSAFDWNVLGALDAAEGNLRAVCCERDFLQRERDKLQAILTFLAEKGLTVTTANAAGEPAKLVYFIKRDSELCDLRAVTKQIEAELERDAAIATMEMAVRTTEEIRRTTVEAIVARLRERGAEVAALIATVEPAAELIEREFLSLTEWICEEHPDKPFGHDDCPGPGMPKE